MPSASWRQQESNKLIKKPSLEVISKVPVNVDELAIITTHYNPCDYNLPRRNYWHWRNHLGELSKQLVTVEISFNNHFMIHDSIKIKATEKNILWQKEAGINIGAKTLPPNKKYIAFLDSDLLFDNDNWAFDGMSMLKKYSAIQLFDRVEYLNISGNIIRENIGSVWNYTTHKSQKGCPGGAWMVRRDYFDKIGGLFPYMITGGGDCPMCDGLADTPSDYYESIISDSLRESGNRWKEKARKERKINGSYLPGLVTHLFHGSRKNRMYEGRGILLKNFNVEKDVCLNDDGLLEWTGHNKVLETKVKQYFVDRNEDREGN